MEVDANEDGIPDVEPGFRYDIRGGDPLVHTRTGIGPNGVAEAKVAILPWSEYPEIYAMKDEFEWLGATIRTMSD